MKAIVIIVTALMVLTPYRDKANSRTVSIPDVTMRTTTIAQPVYSGGGHTQRQRYANSCVATAFANAAGVSLDLVHAKIDEMHGGPYPFDQGPIAPDAMIPVMAALGYSVIHTEASPEALPNIPRWSVYITPGVGHAYNISSYSGGVITAWNQWGGYQTFTVDQFAVMRAVGQPTEPYREELHYPDIFIVR